MADEKYDDSLNKYLLRQIKDVVDQIKEKIESGYINFDGSTSSSKQNGIESSLKYIESRHTQLAGDSDKLVNPRITTKEVAKRTILEYLQKAKPLDESQRQLKINDIEKRIKQLYSFAMAFSSDITSQYPDPQEAIKTFFVTIESLDVSEKHHFIKLLESSLEPLRLLPKKETNKNKN